jgi:predicted transcriptional regulator
MELRDKGLTAPEIATALGVSERTVFRYLVGVEIEGGGIMAAARRPGVIKDGHEIAGVTDHDPQDLVTVP